jgi:hypothetical protein
MPVYANTHPLGGIGPKLYTTGPYAYIARPASPVVMRFYRSAEGYTYAEPRCVVGMAPVSRSPVITYPQAGWFIVPDGWPSNENQVFSNYAAVIIKRINATTWLELRWKALDTAAALRNNPLAISPPKAFELWCSHNTSGSLTTTKLASWSYTSGGIFENTPYNALTQPMYVETMLINNVVTWGLWLEYPGSREVPANLSSRIESGSYTIPSGLGAVIGSAVVGQPGVSLYVDNPPTISGNVLWNYTAGNPPFVHYMEFVDTAWVGNSVDMTIMGDAEDTPPVIKIKGLITDAVLSFLIPNEDGEYDSLRLMLDGTIEAGDELTINSSQEGLSVTDSSGTNRYGMLRPGSRLPMFRHGVNKVSISASDWDETLSEHLSISWRDALK